MHVKHVLFLFYVLLAFDARKKASVPRVNDWADIWLASGGFETGKKKKKNLKSLRTKAAPRIKVTLTMIFMYK